MQQVYGITLPQANILTKCKLSKLKLERLYKEAPGDFDKAIQAKGVKSKKLREKLFHQMELP